MRKLCSRCAFYLDIFPDTVGRGDCAECGKTDHLYEEVPVAQDSRDTNNQNRGDDQAECASSDSGSLPHVSVRTD